MNLMTYEVTNCKVHVLEAKFDDNTTEILKVKGLVHDNIKFQYFKKIINHTL